MKTVIRFDQGSLRKPEMTPQGFLRADARAARVGILEYPEYPNPDGTPRRELRLPEDVFRADSLASYEGASVTDGHPTVLVSADNVRTLEAGTVTGAARRDGDWAIAPIVVKDKKLIEKIRRGDTGVSVGYTIMLDETPGVHPVYGRYDAIQRNLVINHFAAAVKVPRAGGSARIRMDGVEDVRADSWSGKLTSAVDGHQHLLSFTDWNGQQCSSGETSYAMSARASTGHSHPWVKNADGTVTIGESEGHTHTLLDENRYSAQRAESQIDRSDARSDTGFNDGAIPMDPKDQIKLLQTQLSEATARASTAEADLKARTDERDDARGKLAITEQTAKESQARLDSGMAAAESAQVKATQARLDAATAEIAELKKSIPDLVRKRATFNARALTLVGDEIRVDSMDERTALEAVNRRIDPKSDLGKLSLVEMQARFDAFYEHRAASAVSLQRAGADLSVKRADAQPIELDPFDPLHNGVGQWASPHAAKKGA